MTVDSVLMILRQPESFNPSSNHKMEYQEPSADALNHFDIKQCKKQLNDNSKFRKRAFLKTYQVDGALYERLGNLYEQEKMTSKIKVSKEKFMREHTGKSRGMRSVRTTFHECCQQLPKLVDLNLPWRKIREWIPRNVLMNAIAKL